MTLSSFRAGGAMGQKVTIYDVAHRANVSVATVSRVLGGSSSVRPSTRSRVLDAISELDYLPSGVAQGLATSTTGVLGVIFPDLDDPTTDEGHETLLYSDEVIRGAEREARSAGRAILIAATHQSNATSLVPAVAGRVDGLIVLARSMPEAEVRSIARQMPVVLLAGRRSVEGAHLVKADNEGGAYELVNHLVEHHLRRRLVFVGGPPDSPDGAARLEGFCRALEDAGLPRGPKSVVRGNFTEASGANAVGELLSRPGPLPDAIVAGNDQMALGAISALEAKGVSIPRDMAVVGFDDVRVSRFVKPALTTVRQPMRALGELSVRLILEQLDGAKRGSGHIVLPTQLILRRSCGCARTEAGEESGRTGVEGDGAVSTATTELEARDE